MHLLRRGVSANVRLIDHWRAQLTIHHLRRLLHTRISLNHLVWLSISRRRLGGSLRLRVPNLRRLRFTKWRRIILNIEMSRFYQVLKGRGIEAALEDLRIIGIEGAGQAPGVRYLSRDIHRDSLSHEFPMWHEEAGDLKVLYI